MERETRGADTVNSGGGERLELESRNPCKLPFCPDRFPPSQTGDHDSKAKWHRLGEYLSFCLDEQGRVGFSWV